MERWEKEYLEAIGKDGASKKKSKGTGRGAKIGIGVFCLVVVCGLALLVWMGSTTPKQSLSGVLSGSGASSLSSGISSSSSVASDSTIKPNATASVSSSAGAMDPAQTYIDGIGFHNMMAAIDELTTIESRMNSELVATSFSPTASAIQGYKSEIKVWQSKVQSLTYHKSYQEVLQCSVNEAAAMNALLDCVSQNADTSTINRYAQSLSDLHGTERTTLLSAFDANGISYTVAADGSLSYSYKQY